MKTVHSDWQGAVLVCGKCTKKVGGGFGAKGKLPLAKALRRLLGLKKGRRAALGIVETRCLGVCPKNAVVMVDTRTHGGWLVVPAGVALDRVAARLAPPPQQPQSASSFATSASSSASASP
ncbi:(2Fe-2S) ferredoxin domain-containing protein [Sphingomonas sp. Tas61C01]|uniref:(2Fe-2S) ferredoxin domain-containing protein n=1 Tax=Sphingomonas sp. Tas61C01 TaxID=3458297 RepID=UPI00403EA775